MDTSCTLTAGMSEGLFCIGFFSVSETDNELTLPRHEEQRADHERRDGEEPGAGPHLPLRDVATDQQVGPAPDERVERVVLDEALELRRRLLGEPEHRGQVQPDPDEV